VSRTISLVTLTLLGSACAVDGEPSVELEDRRHSLTAELERSRLAAIRDVAAGLGLTNGVLLAGIAQSETNLSHCWSEATWACEGPSSPSCDDGPVIAGSGDGACSLQEGGLGMFQFDAGTHAETLARDGEDILLLEGNIAEAVDFVGARVIEDIDGVETMDDALGWLNAVPIEAGDPLMEAWASFIVCRYNGCCSESGTCEERRADYRDNAIGFYEEYGADFWSDTGEPEPDGPDPDGSDPEPDDGDGGFLSSSCSTGGSGAPSGLALAGLLAVLGRRARRAQRRR
jgi:MYXO-CTERM domain-containing protein